MCEQFVASRWILFLQISPLSWASTRPMAKRNQPILCYRERPHQYADRHECIEKYTSGPCCGPGEELSVKVPPRSGVYASIFSPEGGGCGAWEKSAPPNMSKSLRLLTSSFVAPANIFWNPMPTPSITARRMAQLMAPFLAALYPPRIASAPPVKKPAICVVLESGNRNSCLGYLQSRCICGARSQQVSCRVSVVVPAGNHSNNHQPLIINWRCHIRIFLFPDPLDGAVECAEHATPDTEVAAQYRRAHLDGCDGS